MRLQCRKTKKGAFQRYLGAFVGGSSFLESRAKAREGCSMLSPPEAERRAYLAFSSLRRLGATRPGLAEQTKTSMACRDREPKGTGAAALRVGAPNEPVLAHCVVLGWCPLLPQKSERSAGGTDTNMQGFKVPRAPRFSLLLGDIGMVVQQQLHLPSREHLWRATPIQILKRKRLWGGHSPTSTSSKRAVCMPIALRLLQNASSHCATQLCEPEQ